MSRMEAVIGDPLELRVSLWHGGEKQDIADDAIFSRIISHKNSGQELGCADAVKDAPDGDGKVFDATVTFQDTSTWTDGDIGICNVRFERNGKPIPGRRFNVDIVRLPTRSGGACDNE